MSSEHPRAARPLRIVILTGTCAGSASLVLPLLKQDPAFDLCAVLYAPQHFPSAWARLKRDLRKTRKIGLFGALIGLRIRRWHAGEPVEPTEAVARRVGVPFEVVERLNSEQCRQRLRELQPDIGLILGCGLIKPDVLEIPRLGMVNIHGDILPQFRGGTSILWPIYEGWTESGFTIHRVDAGIDTGAILHVERYAIDFRPTLRETFEANIGKVQRAVPAALLHVLQNFDEFLARAEPQTKGRAYTTPTLRQYRRMVAQNRRLYQEQQDRRTAEQTRSA
jgi:methionyl-tRNA formyltransferase